jgi:hypothetical protein
MAQRTTPTSVIRQAQESLTVVTGRSIMFVTGFKGGEKGKKKKTHFGKLAFGGDL